VNVGELLRERDRLLGVIDEAKTARVKLKQLNVLIAMYGDGEHVELISANGALSATCDVCGESFSAGRGLSTHKRTMHGDGDKPAKARTQCDECGAGPFKGAQGLSTHKHRVHTGRIVTDSEAAKKATKATKARKAS
jgi:hypothetical protein